MKHTNALIHESSPYLLQHAHNPVNWYPWGDAAFQKAREEHKPVFLSIGYSTCHWCHVMERESFEDQEVAAMLNESFVAVKVDKEERPDVDAVYMGVCQALTGSGGWPLTVFLTPEQKPFFAGTYFPKHRRYGQVGLMELLETVGQRWRDDRDGLVQSGEEIARAVAAGSVAGTSPLPDGRAVAQRAAQQLCRSFDAAHGGFGGAPKFPMPHYLLFLLRCHHLGVAEGALDVVESTLTAMFQGGIYDHIGGGFSRYSTDERWLAPHFEKMLYDNALLVTALVECYQVTHKELYRGVARQTLSYIRREMTGDGGGFYSAQDADSDGVEGRYYTFARSEILTVLGAEQGEAFCRRYGVTEEGNFEGKSILNLLHHKSPELPDGDTSRQLAQLLQYRGGRYALHKDDKVLTSWNALMIVACAKAWRVLGEREYLDMAERAHEFLGRHLTLEDGSLAVSYREGRTGGRGLLDDYAFLAWACLELYEATFAARYLAQAASLLEQIIARFAGEGAFYLYPVDGEPLLFRPVERTDNAVPSGNSVAAWCLARMAGLTGEARWRDAAQRQLEAYGDLFQSHPTACAFALLALMQEAFPSRELLCVLPDDAGRHALALRWGGLFQPQTAVLVKSPGEARTLARLAPYTEAYPLGDSPAFYLCKDYSCSAPVGRLEEVLDRLE